VLSVPETTWVLCTGLGSILAPALVHLLGEGGALIVAGALVPAALDRDTFLLTVTGQPDSHDAAVERAERHAPVAA